MTAQSEKLLFISVHIYTIRFPFGNGVIVMRDKLYNISIIISTYFELKAILHFGLLACVWGTQGILRWEHIRLFLF